MADWLLNAARQLKIDKASLNLFDGTFFPKELNIKPLVINAEDLKQIISKELIGNGFELEFIKEAKIDFQFPDLSSSAKKIYCFPYLIDIEDRRYEAGRIIEEAYESTFDAFSDINLYPTGKL